VGSLVAVVLTGPAGARAAQAAFGRKIVDVVPFTAGIGVLYTGGACLAEDFAGSRGYVSSAVGGALAGGVSLGIKHRSGNAAFAGALGVGSLCALSTLAVALEPSVQTIRAAQSSPVALMEPGQLAASAASSRSYTSKLQ